MAEMVIRCGFAGSGFAAKFHYEALQRVHSVKVQVAGAYSPTAERLNQFTGPRNLKAFNNLDDLIDNVDVLHVCTPPATHEQIVIAALNKNRHVIVEKTETKQGWSSVSPDESWFTGYQHEMEAFYKTAAFGVPVESDSSLAADTIATIYAGYVSAERKGAEVSVSLL
jgi:hypothetical protein